ncbi:MAG: DUF87 domain-containing protein [Salinibacterium sp.]|nr:MAG: DUF87 domain-containing protein [Salinibacterium sp.]
MRIRLSKSIILDLMSPQVLADGFRAWVAGESGSGKSSAAMLFASQIVEQDGQVIVLDAHGEYERLWEVKPGAVVKLGYGSKPVDESSVEFCMELVRQGKSVLIDLSHWTDLEPPKLDAFVLDFIRELYKLRRECPRQTFLIVEESQNFMPQQQESGQAQNIKVFLGIMTGGRKYGLNFILCSQQQSLVDVRAIRSCNVRVFLRISDEGDWKKVRAYMPENLSIGFKAGEKRNDITKFKSGEAVLVCRWIGEDKRVQLALPEVTPRQPLIEAMKEVH